MCSAWYDSIASMSPEARAASSVSPLPCATESERALGLVTITTGTPIVSSPVTSAMRVMPHSGIRGIMRASVSSGGQTRWVPWQKPFSMKLRSSTGHRALHDRVEGRLVLGRGGEPAGVQDVAGDGGDQRVLVLRLVRGRE